MAEQLAFWLKAERVPKDASSAGGEIVEITDAFCAAYPDAEYGDLCRAPAALGRKRPSPLLRGDRRICAAAIVHTAGWVDFLADPAQTPHLRTEQLAELRFEPVQEELVRAGIIPYVSQQGER